MGLQQRGRVLGLSFFFFFAKIAECLAKRCERARGKKEARMQTEPPRRRVSPSTVQKDNIIIVVVIVIIDNKNNNNHTYSA